MRVTPLHRFVFSTDKFLEIFGHPSLPCTEERDALKTVNISYKWVTPFPCLLFLKNNQLKTLAKETH